MIAEDGCATKLLVAVETTGVDGGTITIVGNQQHANISLFQ